MLTNTTSAVQGQRARSGTLLSLWLAALAAGCSGLLDVKNPNNVNIDDLNNPAAASAIANGALSTMAVAFGHLLTSYSDATDELTWIGSRDAWGDLDLGYLSGITNEFVDEGFPLLGTARWWSDEAIRRLSAFDAAGTLPSRDDLARSYLYAAIAYTTIGDMFEDWPIGSDRTTAAAPLGPANMAQVYDTAITYTTRGIAIAQATGSTDLELALTAMRARARHARVVWQKLNPFSAAAVPNLVNDAAAVADANAAIALLPSADWKFQFGYSAATVEHRVGFEVNERLESRFGALYIVPSADNKTVAGCGTPGGCQIRLLDPIDGTPDPVVLGVVTDFVAGLSYGSLTVLSAREMRLIVAEAALAAGDLTTFATQINAVRGLNGLTPWNQAAPQIPALDMYKHERRVNLFFQGRRLSDHYRFGEPADKWPITSEAYTKPGTFFPITNIEILANCHINGTC